MHQAHFSRFSHNGESRNVLDFLKPDILTQMPPSEVNDAVQAIQAWLDDPPGEAVVRQCIVLRLLMAAGFDIWNPEEVHPEETNVTGNRADFLIRRGAGKFALELKGMGATLQAREYQQALNYAVSVGTRWAIVTNGRLWRVLDERRDGDWEAKIALTVEMARDDQHFAEDICTLLNPSIWEQDAFADAVQAVIKRQQQRKDEARIRREKTKVVEETQGEFEISTFEKAAEAAVKMGRITEAERDVLLNRSPNTGVSPDEIVFSYAVGNARASAIYRPAQGIWTVQAGSTARRELLPGSKNSSFEKWRQKLLNDGILVVVDEALLKFTQDLTYNSPSSAAADIAGGSRNGWDCWLDSRKRPAQHYRPKKD